MITKTHGAIPLEYAMRRAMLATDVPSTVREARDRQQDIVGHRRSILTTPSANVKIAKGAIPTVSLALSPSTEAGWDSCVFATAECAAACLAHSAGRMAFDAAREARVWRTTFAARDPHAFLTIVRHEVSLAVKRLGTIGLRLNVASDIRWERFCPDLLTADGVRAYDYTKYPARLRDDLDGRYRIVQSFTGTDASAEACIDYVGNGGTAAVVFATAKGEALPAEWHGIPVIDGDVTDMRADDPRGVIVGLRAKGAAKGAPVGGFVQPAA